MNEKPGAVIIDLFKGHEELVQSLLACSRGKETHSIEVTVSKLICLPSEKS